MLKHATVHIPNVTTNYKQILMKQFYSIIILFLNLNSFAQSYEGTLTYISDFEISEELLKMGTTKQIMLDNNMVEGAWHDTIRTVYKQGNYHMSLSKKPQLSVIYRADSNKIFSFQYEDGLDICTVTDASIDLEFVETKKMPVVQKLKKVVDIGGITCNIIRIKWATRTYDYYYNPAKFKINSSLFSKHVCDGWAAFTKISNALPVKTVLTVNGMVTITITLVSTKVESVEEKKFLVPKLIADKDLNVLKTPNVELMRIEK